MFLRIKCVLGLLMILIVVLAARGEDTDEDYEENSSESIKEEVSNNLTPVQFITFGRVAETVHKYSQLEDQLAKMTRELDKQGKQIDLLLDAGCGGEQVTDYLLDERMRRKALKIHLNVAVIPVNASGVPGMASVNTTKVKIEYETLKNKTKSKTTAAPAAENVVTDKKITSSKTTPASSVSTTSAPELVEKDLKRSKRQVVVPRCRRDALANSELLERVETLENRIKNLERQLQNTTGIIRGDVALFQELTSHRLNMMQKQLDEATNRSEEKPTTSAIDFDIERFNASMMEQLGSLARQMQEDHLKFDQRLTRLEQRILREREVIKPPQLPPPVVLPTPRPLTTPAPFTNILQKTFEAKEKFLKDIGLFPNGPPKIPFLTQFQTGK